MLDEFMPPQLIDNHPDEPTYLDTYAWVLYKLREYEEAKKILEKAVSTTENGTIVEHYGDALYQLGLHDQALKQWEKAKSLGESSDFIEKKIADKQLYE